MKFEIDPNELTTDQRAHVAAFITGWPVSQALGRMMQPIIPTEEQPSEQVLGYTQGMEFYVTEEQRPDAEQKEDLSAAEPPHMQAANLNAIFGVPDVAEDILAHAEVMMDLNKSVPLDKEGLPWDSRIHASTKTFIADGSWKLRRGVDPISVDMVKHQLRELMAVPTVTSHVPVPQATIDDALLLNGIPAPKSIDQQPVDIPATVTLTGLIARMSAAIVAGKITQATVSEMCAKHGVSEFMLLSSRPDLLPLIDADMKAMGV